MPVIDGGDVRMVGNGDVVEDMGGQVSSQVMDGDRDVSPWANVWDGPTSSCTMDGSGLVAWQPKSYLVSKHISSTV